MESRPLNGGRAMHEGGRGFTWCEGWPPLSPVFSSLLSRHLFTNQGSLPLCSFVPSNIFSTPLASPHPLSFSSLLWRLLAFNIWTWIPSTFSSPRHNEHSMGSGACTFVQRWFSCSLLGQGGYTGAHSGRPAHVKEFHCKTTSSRLCTYFYSLYSLGSLWIACYR